MKSVFLHFVGRWLGSLLFPAVVVVTPEPKHNRTGCYCLGGTVRCLMGCFRSLGKVEDWLDQVPLPAGASAHKHLRMEWTQAISSRFEPIFIDFPPVFTRSIGTPL